MEMTDFGMVTEISPVQFLKDDSPMEVTEFGMMILVSVFSLMKAFSSIDLTLLGMVTDVFLPTYAINFSFCSSAYMKFPSRKPFEMNLLAPVE